MASLLLAIDAREAARGAAEVEAASKRIERGARTATTSVTDLNNSLNRTGAAGSNAAAGLNRTGVAGAGAAQGVKGFSTAVTSATSATSGMVAQLKAMALGFGSVVAVRAAVKAMVDFEYTMATVRGVTAATDEQFKRLSDTARLLGATTKFTAAEAGDALLLLSRAGFTVEESLAGVGGVLNMAIAGALSLSDAADFTANAVRQFGLAASESQRVVDVFALTSNRTNTDVRGLAEALKFAGPMSAAFGHSIESATAAVGVLSDAGIKASLAGTALRGSLSNLAGPTKKAERTIREMGLSLEDLDPATHSLVNIFERLHNSQLNATQSLAIFGRWQAAAALVMANGVDKMKALTKANEEAAGTSQKMADIMQNTLHGALKNLVSAAEAFVLATGDRGVRGAMRELVDTMTGALRILAGMEDMVTENRAAAMVLADAIVGLAAAFSAMISIKVAVWLWTTISAMHAAIVAAGSMSAALAATPWGASMVAIGLLAGAIYGFIRANTEADESVRKFNISLKNTEDTIRGMEKLYTEGGLKAIGGDPKVAQAAAAAQVEAIKKVRDEVLEYQKIIRAGKDIEPTAQRALVRQVNRVTEKTPLPEVGVDATPSTMLETLQRAQEMVTKAVERYSKAIVKADEDERARADAIGKSVSLLADLQEKTEEMNQATRLLGVTDAEAAKRREDSIKKAEEIAKSLPIDQQKEYVNSIKAELNALEDAEKAFKEKEKALEDAKEAEKARKSEIESTTAALEALLNAQQDENDAREKGIKHIDSYQKKQEIARKTTLLMADASLEEQEALIDQAVALFDLIDANDRLSDAERERLRQEQKDRQESETRARQQEAARERMAEGMADLDREIALIGKTNDEKEKAIAIDEFRKQAIEAYGEGTDQAAAAVEHFSAQMDVLQSKTKIWDKQAEAMQRAKHTADALGGAIASTLEDMVFDFRNAQQAANALVESLGRILFQHFVGIPLQNTLSGIFGSALGAPATPRAEGGFINRPELSLLGEAGPEVVVPLSPHKRDRANDLIRQAIKTQGLSIADLSGARAYADGGFAGGMPGGRGSTGRGGGITIINTHDPAAIFRAGLASEANSIINVIASDMRDRKTTDRVSRRRSRS